MTHESFDFSNRSAETAGVRFQERSPSSEIFKKTFKIFRLHMYSKKNIYLLEWKVLGHPRKAGGSLCFTNRNLRDFDFSDVPRWLFFRLYCLLLLHQQVLVDHERPRDVCIIFFSPILTCKIGKVSFSKNGFCFRRHEEEITIYNG